MKSGPEMTRSGATPPGDAHPASPVVFDVLGRDQLQWFELAGKEGIFLLVAERHHFLRIGEQFAHQGRPLCG